MIIQGKPFCIKKFNTENSAIKVKFDKQEVVNVLFEETKKHVSDMDKTLTDNDTSGVVIEGDFVMIDGGNRFLRYFIGPFGIGAAKLEVEGVIRERENEIASFHFKERGVGGIGGGASNVLLKKCAKRMAKKIKKQIKQLEK